MYSADKEGVLLELSAQKRKCEQLLLEKTDLASLVATRNEELSAMDKQLGELRDRLTSITERNVDSDLKVEIVSLRETSLNQVKARLEQETEINNRRIHNLESELDRLTQELIAARKEQATQVTDLESKLEQKTDQVKRLKEELIHVRHGCDAKDNHMSLLNTKLRKQQELAERLQKQYSSQNLCLQDMLNLESKSLENEKKQNEKLVKAVQELQELLRCSRESHNQMERQLVDKTTDFENLLSSKDCAIQRLQLEVNALKDKLQVDPREQLEQELEVFYPAAARASRSLRDRSTFSTTVRSTSIGQLDELNMLREENARLIAEAEENAPLTLAKMLEHKKAVDMITQLQTQLSQVMTERNKWVDEKETLIQLGKEKERRLRRFEQENEDLSAQVRALLHALDESNGTSLAQKVNQYMQRTSSAPSTANEVISANLVTFESIEELHLRNRQLLTALRELGEDRDAAESMNVSFSSLPESAAGDELQKALREIETLKSERKKQSEMIEAVVRQRDALQSIAAAFTPLEPFYRIPPQTNTPDPNTEYLKQKLDEREKELSNMREKLHEQTKEASEQIMKLKDEMTLVKVEERNIASRLESTQSNLEAARSIIDQNKAELQSLRERTVADRKDIKKYEQELRKSKIELATLSEKLRKNEDLVKHLTQERDMFKGSESALRGEVESLKRENQTKNSMKETTKTLQAYMSRIEADASRAKIAEALVEKLEKDNAQLKSRLTRQAKEAAESDESSSKRVEELKKSFVTEQTQEIDRLRQQVSILRTENQDLKKRVLSAKNAIESGAAKRVSELEAGLTEKSEEVTRLVSEIQRLHNEVENLKKMCTDKEEKLKRALSQLNSERNNPVPEPSPDMSAELQSKIAELQSTNDNLQEKLKESMNHTKVALASNQEKDEKLKKVANQARQRISGLQEQIKTLQEVNQSLQVQIQNQNASSASKSDQNAASLEQLHRKVSSLEQENEELLRFRLLNANLELRVKQLEQENQELNSRKTQLEEKLREQPEPIQDGSQQAVAVTTAVTFVAPNNSSSVQAPPTQPVRPLPQQLQPQPTKTATINPLPHPRPVASTIAHVIPTQQAQSTVPAEDVSQEVREEGNSQDDSSSEVQISQVVEEHEQQEMVVEEQVSQEESESNLQLCPPHFDPPTRKRARPSSPVGEPGPSKKSKVENPSVVEAVEDADPATGVESSDTNDDSSDRRPVPSRVGNIVSDVIVIDDNSDDEDNKDREIVEDEDDDGDEDDSGESESEDAESESGNNSSAEGRDSDEEYSRSEAEEEGHEREMEEDTEQDDEGNEGKDEAEDQDEAVIVIGESNESQNDSRQSTGEQVVQDEEVERDDAEVSVESNSQPETSPNFNQESQASSQVFAVPEDQRIISRPTFLRQSGPSYEESDSIVPSTPTLVVPRLGDGPESLNSPRVPQNSFQFASVSREGSPGITAMEGGRLDDTRIDFSQFSEGAPQQAVDQAEETAQLIVPDESASMSAESVTPEPPSEMSSTDQSSVQETPESQVGQASDENNRSQQSATSRQPIVWNAPTSVAAVRPPDPDQPAPLQPPVPGTSQLVRPRRLQLRGTRAFQQTARRAGGWRGGRGRGGGATQ